MSDKMGMEGKIEKLFKETNLRRTEWGKGQARVVVMS